MCAQVQTSRSVSARLAPVVEELELRQPAVVTRSLLTEILAQTQVPLPPEAAAERLVRLGWLLPLRTRGAWEFAPAARAGRYRAGDPWIELRALLAHHPDVPVAVAFESAIWELGHSTHQPDRPVLAHRRGWRPPLSLGVRAVTFDWAAPTKTVRGLPVWTQATILVAAAERPAAQGNWGNADDWLPDTFRAATAEDLLREAGRRRISTLARLGYLAEWAGRNDIADEIEALLPSRRPVTFLGSRDRGAQWSRRWHVYNSLLARR
jgi:AbiEi antitoxin C-terminal domain